MPETSLKAEFDYYLTNQEKLVEQYRGKFIVIKDQTVLGAYDSALSAIQETQKQHPLGTFLVQKCEPGRESYTQNFHSRVTFA
jgi:hypothetical protein